MTNVLSLSLSDSDAAFFEIVGNELRLKADTVLAFEAKSAYDVTVEVHDAFVGNSANDLFAVSLAGIVVNGTEVTLHGPAARTLAGAAGSDTYRFDADDILGLYTLEETSAGSGGAYTVSFAPTTTTGIGFSLGTAGVQTVHPTNLSLRLTSTTAFENLFGGDGNDILSGNSLPNTILGNAGNDRINGGTGNDTYVFSTATATEADRVIEGTNAGIDTLTFSTINSDITLDLTLTSAQSVQLNRTLALNSRLKIDNWWLMTANARRFIQQ